MNGFKLLSVIFLLLGLTCDLVGQNRKELANYLQIKVLISDREDVEKIYGKGEKNVNRYMVSYKTPETSILVEYVPGNCQSKYAMWDVPEWTVDEITYTPQKRLPKLKDLLANKSGFITKSEGDVPSHIEYFNAEKGISIYYDNYSKTVIQIVVKPSLSDEQRFKCKVKNS